MSGYMPRSGIAGSYSNSLFSFPRNPFALDSQRLRELRSVNQNPTAITKLPDLNPGLMFACAPSYLWTPPITLNRLSSAFGFTALTLSRSNMVDTWCISQQVL